MKNANNALKLITPDQLKRRTVLKGVTLGAGAVVLQPFLNALAAEARGEAPPLRVVFVMNGNGLWPHHIQPKGVDRKKSDKLVDRPLSELELPEPIAALEPFKNRLGIIQKLSHKISGGGDHGKKYGALGCFNWRRDVAGQTIDHAIASARPSVIPVVGLGVSGSPAAVVENTVSASGPKRPQPMVCNPEIAFQSLFGSVAEGNAGKTFQARNKLLDWIRSDVKRVQRELPAMDREKLDVYLDTFEQMRTRQDQVATMRDRLKANVPSIDKFNSKLVTERFEAQCAITAAAIASGLTNVVNLDASPLAYYTWKELGVMTDGHAIGHMHPDNPERDKLCIPIRKFHAERIADIARRLDAVKEGNGTVLDNTLIVWMSDSGEEHHGFCAEWPLVTLGNLGGRLKTAGRFLQFPDYQEDAKETANRTVRNFYLALLHAVGDKRENFGELDSKMPAAAQAGPLAEVLA
ncbi:hypothetical protein ETAA8_16730 [Anatilimnocola aggregata]|uniref:DUF1552 domain-containing protein n=1 Tax=Anatilimnocola aggregata TaxID=2528021 RepID=A0A517Y8P6_9BACT|nr:DUF1552 domain-containing protein [Anatilimnocola aggregata]QDU26593.1 hypothetical protein ETAA8_16730 [Anatilimnocola aggregata]